MQGHALLLLSLVCYYYLVSLVKSLVGFCFTFLLCILLVQFYQFPFMYCIYCWERVLRLEYFESKNIIFALSLFLLVRPCRRLFLRDRNEIPFTFPDCLCLSNLSVKTPTSMKFSNTWRTAITNPQKCNCKMEDEIKLQL